MSNNVDALMKKARKTNAHRDKMDHEMGFATPSQGPLSIRLRTAQSAIHCGVATDDWNAVCEGLVMIEDILNAVEPKTREGKVQ